jgi:hypothetical protein
VARGAAAMPGFMTPLRPVEIQVNPHEVLIIAETGAVRRIYTDGRLPPADPIPTAAGYAIGHWKNGELIVETCCFWMTAVCRGGGPHSDAMHITERLYSPKGGMLVDEMIHRRPQGLHQALDHGEDLLSPARLGAASARSCRWRGRRLALPAERRRPLQRTREEDLTAE